MFLFKKKTIQWHYGGRKIDAKTAKALMAKGETVEKKVLISKKWYCRFRVGRKTTEKPLCPDKSAAKVLAYRLYQEALEESLGLRSEAAKYLNEPIPPLLEAFRKDLMARGRTPKHVRLTLTRVQKAFSLSNVQNLKDIHLQKIREAIFHLPLSTASKNHYIGAVKAFTRWAWRAGYLITDPLASLQKWNAETDRRLQRRALTEAEIAKLIQTTERSSRVFRGLSGPDRAALYLMALSTGLRVGELATLRAIDLGLDEIPPVVYVRAAIAKNRREAVLPLPEGVTTYLQRYFSSRSIIPVGEARLWGGRWWERAADMLRIDLQEAGISEEDERGRVDFHSLRTTFATSLARAGVPIQVAQRLLRHSTPVLTAKTYTKLEVFDLARAVNAVKLPSFGGELNGQAAGGTGGGLD